MRHEHDRAALRLEPPNAIETASLERLVPHREHFVDQQHLRVHVDRDGEPQPNQHP
jgi:hypothetical protein